MSSTIMKSMKNTIWNLDKDNLQQMLDASNSIAEVILKIGLSLHSNNYKELNNKVKKDKLSLDKLNENRNAKFFKGINKFELEEILIENSTYNKQDLKRRIIKENLIDYKCAICTNIGEWNNQKLTLQLDHINGVNTDNRLENLRFLCPNCHSQTDTYTGKNTKREITQNTCIECGCNICRQSTRCNKCARKDKPNYKFEISKEELQTLIEKYPMTYIGKMFDVSSNAVKKRCIKLEIDYKKPIKNGNNRI